MDFGFTKDPKQMQWAQDWRDAAIADGWSHEPTYNSEPEDRACQMSRDGFVAQILTRDIIKPAGKWLYEADVHVWAPDRLAIDVPRGEAYDWNVLVDRIRTCPACKRTDVDTVRVFFAGRCCADCASALREKMEQPGWCD